MDWHSDRTSSNSLLIVTGSHVSKAINYWRYNRDCTTTDLSKPRTSGLEDSHSHLCKWKAAATLHGLLFHNHNQFWSWKLVELLIESPRMFFFLFYEKKIIKEIGVDTVKVVIISTAAANTEVYFNKWNLKILILSIPTKENKCIMCVTMAWK